MKIVIVDLRCPQCSIETTVDKASAYMLGRSVHDYAMLIVYENSLGELKTRDVPISNDSTQQDIIIRNTIDRYVPEYAQS